MHNKIKMIIFDAGGVIVSFKHYSPHLSKRLGIPIEEIRESYKELHMLERGEITWSEFRSNMAINLGVPKHHIDELSFVRKNNKPILGTWKIIEELRERGYKIVLLSNVSKPVYTINNKLLRMHLFDHKFASCYIGLRKPDPKIFKHVLERLNVLPEEVIFVDDLESNTASAEKLGIRSITFKNPNQLKKELKRFKVL